MRRPAVVIQYGVTADRTASLLFRRFRIHVFVLKSQFSKVKSSTGVLSPPTFREFKPFGEHVEGLVLLGVGRACAVETFGETGGLELCSWSC